MTQNSDKEPIDKLYENIIKLSKEIDKLNFLIKEVQYLTKGANNEDQSKFNTVSNNIISIINGRPS